MLGVLKIRELRTEIVRDMIVTQVGDIFEVISEEPQRCACIRYQGQRNNCSFISIRFMPYEQVIMIQISRFGKAVPILVDMPFQQAKAPELQDAMDTAPFERHLVALDLPPLAFCPLFCFCNVDNSHSDESTFPQHSHSTSRV
jgi:hypothetical protein